MIKSTDTETHDREALRIPVARLVSIEFFKGVGRARTTQLLFSALLLATVGCSDGGNAEKREVHTTSVGQSQPNVVVIFTDDHGYADMSVLGLETDVATPNIDQLARDGALMTSGYVTAPQCIPSRAGLLTGMYQQRFGLEHNHQGPLPLDVVTVPERLQEAGYVTGMVGKWHLEPNRNQLEWREANGVGLARGAEIAPDFVPPTELSAPYRARNRGFTEYYEGARARYFANFDLDGRSLAPEGQVIINDDFRVDVQTDAALSFIDRNTDHPFFLYVAYYAPHVPLEATDEYLARFPGPMPERRRYALAMLSAIDDGIGEIRTLLKDRGLEENTLIFFVSDNGAPLKIVKADEPLTYAGGWDGSLNTPLLGEKGMLSEGGIRVPFIAAWPGTIPSGQTVHEPILSLDVTATALAVAGIDLPAEIDGVDVMPFLSGKAHQTPRSNTYWKFWNQYAVRSGDLKYIGFLDRDQEFLFDVATDPGELNDLLAQRPDDAARLRAQAETWMGETLVRPVAVDHRDQERKMLDHYFGEDDQ